MATTLKQKLAIGAAALAGVAAGTFGVTSALAAPSVPAQTVPTPAPPSSDTSADAPDAAETPDAAEAPGAPETVDPNESGVTGTGHQDPPGQVDHQSEGAE